MIRAARKGTPRPTHKPIISLLLVPVPPSRVLCLPVARGVYDVGAPDVAVSLAELCPKGMVLVTEDCVFTAKLAVEPDWTVRMDVTVAIWTLVVWRLTGQLTRPEELQATIVYVSVLVDVVEPSSPIKSSTPFTTFSRAVI